MGLHWQLLLPLRWQIDVPGFLSSIFGQCCPGIFSLIFFLIEMLGSTHTVFLNIFPLLASAVTLEVSANFHFVFQRAPVPLMISSQLIIQLYFSFYSYIYGSTWGIVFTDSNLLDPQPSLSFQVSFQQLLPSYWASPSHGRRSRARAFPSLAR